MPYQVKGDCAVNSSTGETVKCHDTHAQALAHLKALYANVPDASKKEHLMSKNPFDTFANWFNTSFKEAKSDAPVKEEEKPSEEEKQDDTPMEKVAIKSYTTDFSIFKQTDDTYRWVGVTSSGFRDRDKQLVTSDALKADVERMNKEASFGNLSFWHVMFKEEHPQTLDPGIALDIASCDVSEMAGEVSNLESGVFFDNAVGKAFADVQNDMGFSIEFFYPASEPDAQGNFNNIHRYRRTILPKQHASNLMSDSTLAIQKATREDKMSRFAQIVGEEKALATRKAIEEKERELAHKGVERKETDAVTLDVAALTKELSASFATKSEMEAITKSLSDISAAITTFTTGYVASQKKESDALAAQLKEIGDKVQELYGDAPNFLKGTRPSQSEKTVVAPDSPAVKQAQELVASLAKAHGKSDGTPMGDFASFVLGGTAANGT